MRIIFMGTPDFAVPSLDILVRNKYDVAAVVTMPDKPAGRGQQVQESAVKKYAVEHGIKVLQPEKLKSDEFISALSSLKADLQIVVAFRMLPEVVWNMPPLGTYNLHASLLPQYRGAAPINWAIINGEKESGATTFKLQHEIDTGSILFQHRVKLSEDITAGELHDILMVEGAELILKTVKAIENGNYELRSQEKVAVKESDLKHAPKIFKETCRVNWNSDLRNVHNYVRGLSPYPTAWSELRDDKNNVSVMKIYRTHKEEAEHEYEPGLVVSDGKNFLKVACINGFIYIDELQLAGKKRMGVTEFLRGFQVRPGFEFI
ncbi:MAG: methionyl-tRNA formyltransferase [Bacteroidia bacterium]